MNAFLYCLDPLEPDDVEELFRPEADIAAQLGANVFMVNHSAVVCGDVDRALFHLPSRDSGDGDEDGTLTPLIYRGWMLTPAEYTLLNEGVHIRGYQLINPPEEYRACHWLPETIQLLNTKITPRTITIPLTFPSLPDWGQLQGQLAPFGSSPVILKDYVKSEKHYWLEACFIPSAAEADVVRRVTERFLDLRGEDLQGGLCFRQFLSLVRTGPPGVMGFPAVKEYRVFIVDGAVAAWGEYWAGAVHDDSAPPPLKRLVTWVQNITSRFFSVDVAQTDTGEWFVIEIGDGQVTGIPDTADARSLLQTLLGRG